MRTKSTYNLNKNRPIYFQIGLALALLAVFKTSNLTFYKCEAHVELSGEMEDNPDIIKMIQLPEVKKKIIKIAKVIKSKKVESFENKEILTTLAKLEQAKNEFSKINSSRETRNLIIPPLIFTKPKIKRDKNKVFDIVERMPFFGACQDLTGIEAKACSDKAIMEYLSKSIRFPALAKEINLEGRVIVEFIIDEQGNVTNSKILRDIGAGCGDEVLRVISKMPDWSPGFQHNRNVKVKIRVPINFTLQ